MDGLEEAMIGHCERHIFNADRGLQFTSQALMELRSIPALSRASRDCFWCVGSEKLSKTGQRCYAVSGAIAIAQIMAPSILTLVPL